MKRFIYCFIVVFCLSGCSFIKPQKGGSGTFSDGKNTQSLVQSQNPLSSSSLNFDKNREETIKIPKNSIITSFDGTNKTTSVQIVTDTEMKVKETIKSGTVVGAAQKDIAREMGAKLKSLSPLLYIGIVLFLFGGVSLFYPPLKLIINSTSTSIVIAASGLLLIVLPSLIIGQEKLILFIIFGAAAGYFFVYKYSHYSTKSTIYKQFIDSDGNKIRDEIDDLILKINKATTKKEIEDLVKESQKWPEESKPVKDAAAKRIIDLNL